MSEWVLGKTDGKLYETSHIRIWCDNTHRTLRKANTTERGNLSLVKKNKVKWSEEDERSTHTVCIYYYCVVLVCVSDGIFEIQQKPKIKKLIEKSKNNNSNNNKKSSERVALINCALDIHTYASSITIIITIIIRIFVSSLLLFRFYFDFMSHESRAGKPKFLVNKVRVLVCETHCATASVCAWNSLRDQ